MSLSLLALNLNLTVAAATTTPTPVPSSPETNSLIISPTISAILWAFVNILISIVIIFGNILTIIAIRIFRQLITAKSNLFILSLAISDLTVGCTLPYHLAFYLGSDFGKSQELCLIRFFLIIFACCVSSLTLITIAVDRYIAIVYALHYRRYMTRRTAFTIITLNWLAGATIAAIPMFWNHWRMSFRCEFNAILPPWYMAGLITPGFITIWVIMVLLYWRIIREASKHARQLRSGVFNTAEPQSRHGSEWKSVRVVFFIMACFSICWFPYFIVACSHMFHIFETTSVIAYKVAFLLAMTNSGLNPMIYAWKNSSFRNAFVQILCCKMCNNHQITLNPNQCGVPSRNTGLPRQ